MNGRLVMALVAALAAPAAAMAEPVQNVQVGPRPYWLVEAMDPGPLKAALQQCAEERLAPTAFSIGHRGAPLMFPEHTREAYLAAARMGAGVLECDVTFTQDRELVCRHSQCDLHTTTDVLAVPELAARCSEPFTPADPGSGREASARCCTSDFTLAEFRRLQGKMDGSNPQAASVGEYMRGTAAWRTDLHASRGTLMTHAESIELFKSLGVKMTPELKAPEVVMPFQGDYSQQDYARQLIEEYKAAGVPPQDVFPQSFDLEDVRYWIREAPAFGAQAVFLEGREAGDPASLERGMRELAEEGVRIIAPPLYMLVALDEQQRIVPSAYARAAKAAGLDIIAWSLERSGPMAGGGGWYYQSIAPAIDGDGDVMTLLDVLAREVGVRGVFSDWPGTVTYYANCMGLE
ncbi:glycerophosphodiester phosphodiesterase family protein [Geminicoccaceae bacterium 1502E]|nr:glycerophosphodiester phosphodiesterase family protein [Geminicoccaceae bacterium 1502E]